ncbi:phosphopantetheine-binding protein [Streptomyces sp. NPDC059894]|uniref:phosphopantetheine-binding protein n=1 Tax=unclassified Streptomyces TaxID=2593676 RepID=UPI003648718F
MLSTADIKERVVEQLMETLEDVGVVVPGIDGSDELNALGLSSMLYARLVLKLEAEFGVEVFSGAEQPPNVRTVDDVVDAFARAIA